MGDVGGQVVAHEHIKGPARLVLEHRVHRGPGRGHCEVVAGQRAKRVGDGVGVADGPQGLDRVEMVDQDLDG